MRSSVVVAFRGAAARDVRVVARDAVEAQPPVGDDAPAALRKRRCRVLASGPSIAVVECERAGDSASYACLCELDQASGTLVVDEPSLTRLADGARVRAGVGTYVAAACDERGHLWQMRVVVGARGCSLECHRAERTLDGVPIGRIVAVACGHEHGLALTDDGAVLAWGCGLHGALGAGHGAALSPSWQHAPQRLTGVPPVCEIAAGGWHSLLRCADGRVLAFGQNASGQLGLGDTLARAEPTVVHAFTGLRVAQLACGARHSLVLLDTGDVYAFGERYASWVDVSTRDAPAGADTFDGGADALVCAEPTPQLAEWVPDGAARALDAVKLFDEAKVNAPLRVAVPVIMLAVVHALKGAGTQGLLSLWSGDQLPLGFVATVMAVQAAAMFILYKSWNRLTAVPRAVVVRLVITSLLYAVAVGSWVYAVYLGGLVRVWILQQLEFAFAAAVHHLAPGKTLSFVSPLGVAVLIGASLMSSFVSVEESLLAASSFEGAVDAAVVADGVVDSGDAVPAASSLWTNVSVLLLMLLAGLCNTLRKHAARVGLSKEFSSVKVVHSLQLALASTCLFVWVLLHAFSTGVSATHGLGPFLYVLAAPVVAVLAAASFYADHYAAYSMAASRTLLVPMVAEVVSIALVSSRLLFTSVTLAGWLCVGVAVAGLWLCLNKYEVGSDAMMPLYGHVSLPSGTLSLVWSTIMQSHKSRRIFFYLCVNVAFMFVELVYGFWTNSLGLITDAGHMFFDCCALVIGLYAAVMTKWKAHPLYTYGYGRFEVLSGFVNALFLVVIGVFVILEAVHRIVAPAHIHTDRLLLVSLLGLGVNIIGLIFFHDAHDHGGGSQFSGDDGDAHGHSHGSGSEKKKKKKKTKTSGSHGHSHAAEAEHGHAHGAEDHEHEHEHGHEHEHEHGHDHDHDHDHGDAGEHGHAHEHGHGHDEAHEHSHKAKRKSGGHDHGHAHPGGHGHVHDANMQGIFLHILADALGSVGVVISSLLVQYLGWTAADPICAFFVASLILVSVIPLLRGSVHALLQRLPDGDDQQLSSVVESIESTEHVRRVHSVHFWQHSGKLTVGTLHVVVDDAAQQQRVMKDVRHLLKDSGVQDACVQVEVQP